MGRHQVYSVTVVAGNRAGSSQSFPGLVISELVLLLGMIFNFRQAIFRVFHFVHMTWRIKHNLYIS